MNKSPIKKSNLKSMSSDVHANAVPNDHWLEIVL